MKTTLIILLAGLFGWLPVQAQAAPASDAQLLQAMEGCTICKLRSQIQQNLRRLASVGRVFPT